MSRSLLLVGLLLLAPPASALGQTPAERALLERLEQRAAMLGARRAQADSIAEVPHDTIRAGPLLVLTDSAGSPVLRDALARLRDVLAAGLGQQPIASLDDATIVVQFGPPSPGWQQLLGGDAQFVQMPRHDRTARHLGQQLAHAVGQVLAARGGHSLTAWRPDIRLFEDPAPWREATYIELATSSLPSVQACAANDLIACRYALQLADEAATPPPSLTAGLPPFVEQRYHWRANEPALARSYAGCVARSEAEACVDFLDLIGVGLPSMSTRAVGTVLLTAQDLGGEGALARFFADTGAAIVPRLEAAAGVPLDSLLAYWRATIRGHQPLATAVPAGMQWAAVGWILALTVLATRSTRWR